MKYKHAPYMKKNETMSQLKNIQSIYQETILFAAERHGEQKIPGSEIPYIVHVSNVCMEILFAATQTEDFNLPLAMQAALLHDVLEDTQTTEAELEDRFGKAVTDGVKALTKNESLPKDQRISDSLHRIKLQPKEIRAVKLADRITNLQPPPAYWSREKILNYKKDAILIYDMLKESNPYLADRLKSEIERYEVE
jgi:guanosine-3',5'-bis(diphosphate) 3'-pyrophosphohydrolase